MAHEQHSRHRPGFYHAPQVYDPLSSYGIGSALGTGYYAARALLAAWSGDDAAGRSYQALLDERWRVYSEALAERYAAAHPFSQTGFWLERRRGLERLATSS